MFGMFSHKPSVKPVALTDELSTTISGDDTLVYDRERFVIRRLDANTATIWRLADGTRDLAMLADDSSLTAKTVEESLAKLAAWDLLLAESVGTLIATRRRLIGSMAGLIAAGTFIAPAAASCANGGSPCSFSFNGNTYSGSIDCGYGGMCCETIGGSMWVLGNYECGSPL